jgi:hypothetical protein
MLAEEKVHCSAPKKGVDSTSPGYARDLSAHVRFMDQLSKMISTADQVDVVGRILVLVVTPVNNVLANKLPLHTRNVD